MSDLHVIGEDESWGARGGRRCARYHGPPPKIVTLCGSTRFREEFLAEQERLTLEGCIVLSVGLFGGDVQDASQGDTGRAPLTDEQNVMLGELHKRKIDLSHEILVINVGGYIGPRTRSEIAYAAEHRIPITYLEPA